MGEKIGVPDEMRTGNNAHGGMRTGGMRTTKCVPVYVQKITHDKKKTKNVIWIAFN